jgi:hypothetical protein
MRTNIGSQIMNSKELRFIPKENSTLLAKCKKLFSVWENLRNLFKELQEKCHQNGKMKNYVLKKKLIAQFNTDLY